MSARLPTEIPEKPPQHVFPDAIRELPPNRSDCLHLVRAVALLVFSMAQDVVSGQGILGRWVGNQRGEPSESAAMPTDSGGILQKQGARYINQKDCRLGVFQIHEGWMVGTDRGKTTVSFLAAGAKPNRGVQGYYGEVHET